ncbi:hypothetical protein NDU88_001289 [Pleurodeles waltl]|uniref:Uncharacterized protein n=1 Tax=Pleurodeles waltl TaxID=8319 RepID=A0AAV7SAF2_PLEWA|nr:hypothetical protein NDU88_001289 [Pleurodeles waltl]
MGPGPPSTAVQADHTTSGPAHQPPVHRLTHLLGLQSSCRGGGPYPLQKRAPPVGHQSTSDRSLNQTRAGADAASRPRTQASDLPASAPAGSAPQTSPLIWPPRYPMLEARRGDRAHSRRASGLRPQGGGAALIVTLPAVYPLFSTG